MSRSVSAKEAGAGSVAVARNLTRATDRAPSTGSGPTDRRGSIRTGLQANLTIRVAEKIACTLQTGGGRR